jgi:hypothetical protein
MGEEIPTISFCEMVRQPQSYFDKTVRVTATLVQAVEAQYLNDEERCQLGRDDRIGVRFSNADDEEREARNKFLKRFRSIEYGGRACVTVIGSLRNSSRRDFAWYRYRFDITRIEGLAHIVVPYQGELQGGRTYLAAVRGDKDFGLALITPVRMPMHYAVHVEWTNLSEFPELERLRGNKEERPIVFSVVSDQIQQMTERRWNRTIQCKIISIK